MTNRLVDGELLLALEVLAQRLALDVRHHVVQKSFDLARIEQRKDVRVIEPRRDLDLAEKPVGAERRGEFRMQNLERDDALVLGVLREIDRGHSAATKLTVNGVGRSEKLPDALDRQRQARSPPILVGLGFPQVS